jgi:hypothetical protein
MKEKQNRYANVGNLVSVQTRLVSSKSVSLPVPLAGNCQCISKEKRQKRLAIVKSRAPVLPGNECPFARVKKFSGAN